MNDAPHDPYRNPEEPEQPWQPEDTSPSWGAPSGAQQPPPTYPAYQPPPGPPAAYPPPYGMQGGYPPVPGALDPYASQYSDKNKMTAGLLQLLLPFVGVCGVGRLYAGHTTIGVLQLVLYWVSFPLALVFIGLPMLVGIWVWTVVDGIMMLSGQPRDGQGRLMR